MHCRHCAYPLWGVRDHVCPECGRPFDPGDYEFAAATVHFCCPHCAQPYLGTDERGHPEPAQFDCTGCGKPIGLGGMVVRMPPGVSETQTKRGEMPWLERRRQGTIAAFLRTLLLAHVAPMRVPAMLRLRVTARV